jgi:hypothetical protein
LQSRMYARSRRACMSASRKRLIPICAGARETIGR